MIKQVFASISVLYKKNIFLFVSIFLLAGILLLTISTVAQNPFSKQSIEVLPPSQELEGDPGKTVSITAKVRNKSDNTLPISVRIEDFTAQGEEGQIALIDRGESSITKWSTVKPTKFSLAPGEIQEVTATVRIPKQGIAGGQYGSFIFSINPEFKEGNSAELAQEVASLFLLKVSGEVDERLTINNFEVRKFSEFGPVPFKITFANPGNVHIKTYGLVNVTDMFGQRVTDIVVPGVNIFPGANRIVPVNLDKRFLFGKYKATALMYYGTQQNNSLNAEATFYVIPWKILLGLVVILFILSKMKKRLKKVWKALFGK